MSSPKMTRIFGFLSAAAATADMQMKSVTIMMLMRFIVFSLSFGGVIFSECRVVVTFGDNCNAKLQIIGGSSRPTSCYTIHFPILLNCMPENNQARMSNRKPVNPVMKVIYKL
jgi:hypothetical protein